MLAEWLPGLIVLVEWEAAHGGSGHRVPPVLLKRRHQIARGGDDGER
jgi:hypothetical protein